MDGKEINMKGRETKMRKKEKVTEDILRNKYGKKIDEYAWKYRSKK